MDHKPLLVSAKRHEESSNKMEGCHLLEEIIENILLKLPTKSIIRFRSVSKSWFELIKSTHFVNRHLIESKESFLAAASVVNRRFLAISRYDEHKGGTFDDPWMGQGQGDNNSTVVNFELPPPYYDRDYLYFKLVAHCNGIVCLTIDSDFILLVNPSLKQVKTLPSSPSPVKNSVGCFKMVGFGFDNGMDLKVVRITGLVVSPQAANRDKYQRGEIYSLRSNAWRELKVFPLLTAFCWASYGSTFFNGVVHWCAKTDYSDWRILTFNMSTELFEHVEFPQGWDTDDCWKNHKVDYYYPALFVLNNESLAFLSYCPPYYAGQLVHIWTMNKHGNEVAWTKLNSIGPLPNLLKPIGFTNKQEFMCYLRDGKLILYDLLNHRRSVVGDGFTVLIEMVLCRSSLVSINV